MSKHNFAAIDIGSNAVRLLIKGIDEGETAASLVKVFIVRVPLRLGQDSFTLGRISKDKSEKLIRVIKAFCQMMQVYDVISYRACATSAMRDAANGQELAALIGQNTGVHIDIISGQEEAALIYDSRMSDLFCRNGNYVFVDVGGGSTEVTLICDRRMESSRSYNVGTVRKLHQLNDGEEEKRMADDLHLLASNYSGLSMIGLGGNINKLFKLSGLPKGEALPMETIQDFYNQMKPMSVSARMAHFQLKPDRADVIVPAARIFLNIASYIGCTSVWVPTIGIGDGITHSLCCDYLYSLEK